jgi:hypothetical protein
LDQAFYPLLNSESFVSFIPTNVNVSAQPLAIVDMNNDGMDDIVGATQDYINIQRQLPEGGFAPLTYQTDYRRLPGLVEHVHR